MAPSDDQTEAVMADKSSDLRPAVIYHVAPCSARGQQDKSLISSHLISINRKHSDGLEEVESVQ